MWTQKTTPWVCLLVILLVCWYVRFPVSGNFDAVNHYASFFKARARISYVLDPWSRPLYVAINAPAALLGGLPGARLFHFCVSLCMCWQTVKYAQDLRMKNTGLLVPFCFLQPYAFVLAADTMTELPFALAVIVLLRLWHHRRYTALAVTVGFTPLIRPEGFFLGLLLGLLFLTSRPTGLRPARRWGTALLGTLGILSWMLAGRIFAADWLFPYHAWWWGSHVYGQGQIYDYLLRLPFIIGFPLILPWLAGTFRRDTASGLLPAQVLWWLVFTVHSILWTGGYMSSAGLLRVMACVTPCAALVMLKGWNSMVRLQTAGSTVGRVCFGLFFVASANWALIQNYLLPETHYGLVQVPLTSELRTHAKTAPFYFSSDNFILTQANLKLFSPRRLQTDGESDLKPLLANFPVGTVGFWEDQHAPYQLGLRIDDLLHIGYEVVEETTLLVQPTYDGSTRLIHAAVVRKHR